MKTITWNRFRENSFRNALGKTSGQKAIRVTAMTAQIPGTTISYTRFDLTHIRALI
jgi:hypothetical protein